MFEKINHGILLEALTCTFKSVLPKVGNTVPLWALERFMRVVAASGATGVIKSLHLSVCLLKAGKYSGDTE